MPRIDNIVVKSFNGIGDALFPTPTFRRIKEKYPESKITYNTNVPQLFSNNPYIDVIGTGREGIFLGYADPIHCKAPVMHHIEADFDIICKEYDLALDPPDLKPEIYLPVVKFKNTRRIGVQVLHKGHWDSKKVWPKFEELIDTGRKLGMKIEPIRRANSIGQLVDYIASCSVVVCAEGGISHIARALDIPAVVVYGGFALPEWNGYDSQVNILSAWECSPCYNSHKCKPGGKPCMEAIQVSDVLESVEKFIK